jgi:hypothetical protein
MWNFLLNLQSVCDSRKTDDTFVFFCLCKKAHCKKKVALRTQTLLAWPDIAMLFQTDWKISLTFLSRKKEVNFSIELSLVQYIQVILNLPFKFYETLVEVNLRLWECERWDVVRDCGREKRWAAHKEISSVSQKWIKTVKNIVAIILTTLPKNQNYLGNYLGNYFRKLGITITR